MPPLFNSYFTLEIIKMAVAGCINAYDCAGCYLTTLQQLQSDNIGVAINYTAPWEYWRRQLDYIKYTDKCWKNKWLPTAT